MLFDALRFDMPMMPAATLCYGARMLRTRRFTYARAMLR